MAGAKQKVEPGVEREAVGGDGGAACFRCLNFLSILETGKQGPHSAKVNIFFQKNIDFFFLGGLFCFWIQKRMILLCNSPG